jgi:hypothetical protein
MKVMNYVIYLVPVPVPLVAMHESEMYMRGFRAFLSLVD